jgi:hypothetical protein
MMRHKNQNKGMFLSKVSTFKEIVKVPKKESQQYIKQSLPFDCIVVSSTAKTRMCTYNKFAINHKVAIFCKVIHRDS